MLATLTLRADIFMRKTATLLLLSAFSLITTFAYQWLVGLRLGADAWRADLFFAALAVPQVATAILGGAWVNGLVPVLARTRGTVRGVAFATLVKGSFSVFGVLFIGIWLLASAWLALLFAAKANDGANAIWVVAAAVTFSAYLQSISLVEVSILYSERLHVRAELAVLCGSGAGLLVFLFMQSFHGAVLGFATKGIVQFALTHYFVRLRISSRFDKRYFLLLWRRSAPLVFGGLVTKVDPFLDKSFAATAPAGGLTVLHLLQQTAAAGQMIFNKAFVAPIVPDVSCYFDNKESTKGLRLIFAPLLFAAAFFLFGAAAWFFWGGKISHIIVAFLNLDSHFVSTINNLLIALLVFWVAGAAGFALSSALYAIGDTKIPMIIGVCGSLVGIALRPILYDRFGISGLAYALSGYFLINALALFLVLFYKAASLTQKKEALKGAFR